MDLPPIGLILDTFPALSETFVLREIQQLEKDGTTLRIAAFHSPVGRIQDGAGPLIRETLYRPPFWRLSSWARALPELARPVFWSESLRILGEAIRSGLPAASGSRESPLVRASTHTPAPTTLAALQAAFWGLRVWHVLLTGAWMAAAFRRAGARHVHAHFLGVAAVAGRLAAKLLKVSFSVSVHGSDLCKWTPLQDGNVSSAAFVITCTARNQRALAERYSGRVHLAHHGIDAAAFGDLRTGGKAPWDRGIGADLAPVLILSVARLVEKKGIDILLEAIRRLCDRGYDLRGEIIGDGPERTRLQEDARRLRIADRVAWRGECTQDEVLEAYRRASLFVLPCRRAADGDEMKIPNVLVEALACGLPVVSTRAGAVEELVEHEMSGRLARAGDADSLADEIAWMLEHPSAAREMAGAGERRVRAQFDLEQDPVLEVFRRELG